MYQPIETIYNGYRFRSRLEARWAVFFDTLGINYEYEKEGYDLDGRGTWYLPDFWIEAWDMFVEIKPNFPSDEEESKCRKLSKCLGKSSLLLWGQPWVAPVDKKDKHSLWKHEYQFDIFHPDEQGVWYQGPNVFGLCRRCSNAINFVEINSITLVEQGFGKLEKCQCDTEKYPMLHPPDNRLIVAYNAARQARFGR